MLDGMIKTVNKRKYQLFHNGEIMNFMITRIKGARDYINHLAKNPELKENKAFFIYNEYNFASFGMSEKLDLVWVDWDGKVIHLEESFDMNKISKKIDNSKFIYVFPKHSIKKNKILANDTITHAYKRKKGEIKISDFI